MISQLLLSKRLFSEGKVFARRSDPISGGMAISLFQDAVELLVWALIKEKSVAVRDSAGFVDQLNALASEGHKLADRPKVLELNRARIAFKHYGNLPAHTEAVKFQTYAEDFLKAGMQDFFGISFELLSMVSLVAFDEVKKHLEEAEKLLANGAPLAAAGTELALAKSALFGRVARHIPSVDKNLERQDDALSNATDGGRFGGFRYVTGYLNMLRDLSVATLMQLPLEDYAFITSRLPVVHNYGGQRVQTRFEAPMLSEPDCRRVIEILVGISIRLEGVLQAR